MQRAQSYTLEQTSSIFFKLKQNRTAFVSFIFIVSAVLLAIFAYFVVPDKTPDANTMVLEISAKKAGFKQTFLKIPKQRSEESISWIQGAFLGKSSSYTLVPINSYALLQDTLMVQHYVDQGITDTLKYSFAKLGLAQATTAQELDKKAITQRTYYLGTDRYGRDILSRLIIGTRVSLMVGFVSVVLSLSIGIVLGSMAGWYGGKVDGVIMYIINILWAIPTLLLVFAITLTIGKGFWEIFIAIGLTSWVSAARLIRGQVMQIKEMDYITAAKALGFKDSRIIAKHILPNITGPVMVIAASNFATAILIEAGLSFLGVGVQPPTPSWGLMIKEHYNFLIAGNPLPAIVPGLAIMVLVLAFNILGNALRDAVDVRS